MARSCLSIAAMVMALRLIAWAQSPISVTQTVTLTPRLDVFRTQGQAFTLSDAPAANTAVMVFLNGVLMLQGEDYSLVQGALTFTGQEIGESPIIQVMYWRIGQ